MRIALLTKNNMGFDDGSCRCDGYVATLHLMQDRCNGLVLSWILNTISKELSAGIVFESNAILFSIDLKELPIPSYDYRYHVTFLKHSRIPKWFLSTDTPIEYRYPPLSIDTLLFFTGEYRYPKSSIDTLSCRSAFNAGGKLPNGSIHDLTYQNSWKSIR
ncbi:hypothetical protein GQ457_10G010780 [Hibiscus cannabinus]